MSSKSIILAVVFLYIFGKATLSSCEVVWVKRNVTDSFFVGNHGCKKNPRICMTRSALCHADNWCLCSPFRPTFRNPIIEVNSGKIMYGNDSFGCVNNQYIRFGVDGDFCPFSPFQVIPYSNDEPTTIFTHDVQVYGCFFENAWGKFPHDNAEFEIKSWISADYIDISSSGNKLFFKWKKSVPLLKGTIITFNFQCDLGSGYKRNCLRAKVFGTRATPFTCVDAEYRREANGGLWLQCGKDNLFITSFYRSDPLPNGGDPTSLLHKLKCCNAALVFTGGQGECIRANWWYILDSNNESAFCPKGYFLNGLFRSRGRNGLSHILYSLCCKPNYHPDRYGLCYEEDVGESFNKAGWSGCSKPGYYITGIYRGNGSDGLNNIDRLTCCQMATDAVAQLNTTAQISTQYRISQTTPKAPSSVTSEKSSSVARTTVRMTEKPVEQPTSASSVQEILCTINYALLAITIVQIIVFGTFAVFVWKKMQRMQDENFKKKETQNNDEQERSPARDALFHETPTNPGGHNNDAFYHQQETYNGDLSENYEEPANYQPLDMNNPENVESNYQSLTITNETEDEIQV